MAFATAFYILLTEMCLLPLLIVVLAVFSWRIAFRSEIMSSRFWRGIILLALLILILAFLNTKVILSVPVFDFINRCRPSGTGLCITGRTYIDVEREILIEQARTVFAFIIGPSILTIISVYLISVLRGEKINAA